MPNQTTLFAQFDAQRLTSSDPPPANAPGATFDPATDGERLDTAQRRVFDYMRRGQWRTLFDIAHACNCSESGAGARMRCFRQQPWRSRYGVERVERRRIGEGGTWEYRLILQGAATVSGTADGRESRPLDD